MGRIKTKATSRHITRAEKDARLQDMSIDGAIVAPSFLNATAVKEFNRVVKAFEQLGTLDALDLATLAVYADAWAGYVETTKAVNKLGPVIVKRRVTGRTEVEANPALAVQAEYVKRIHACSLKLGMATTDRLRLAVPKGDDYEDDFTAFEDVFQNG